MIFTKTAMTLDMDALSVRLEETLRHHKGKYILQGMVFVIVGVIAALMPTTMAINAELLLGLILLFTGIFQLVLTIQSKMHWWSMLSAFLSIGIGIFMLWKPLSVLFAFVTLLALFMTIEGVCEIFLAFQFHPLRNWKWMMFSGIITLIFAAILWIGFPAFDILYLGWMIAINFLLYGISLLMLVWKVAS